MANLLDGNGLFLESRAYWTTYFQDKFQEIYGPDVNLSSDTPDGQLIGITVQTILDLQDLISRVYSSMDPDNATGKTLDQRVAINGIQRQGGTFTVTPITLINSTSVNLYGIDEAELINNVLVRPDGNPIYTIADSEGNQWYLTTTELGLSAGTHTLNFRAALPGEQLTVPNTITSPVSIVLGVTSVNNPTTYLSLGVNEESDIALKIRRSRSVSQGSQGYLAGLVAALRNINGITDARVYENTGSTTDSDGIPGHSIWVIVAGSASDEDIATAIYRHRNAGAGMKGGESYNVTQVDGSLFNILWDFFTAQKVFIKFSVTSINGVDLPNVQGIVEGLPALLQPGLNEPLNINAVATAAQEIDPNSLITNEGLADGREQTVNFSGVAASGTFKLLYNGILSSSLNWDSSIGDIQTALQSITGLGAALATGSIASQQIVFDLDNVPEVVGIISIVESTLATSAPAAITNTYALDYANTLEPFSKRNQFVVDSDAIIVLPMQLLPLDSSVAVSTELQFNAYGGYKPYTYSIETNNSGGTIDSETGLYESGAVDNVVDTIKVTDTLGNTATAEVEVVA